MKKMKSIYKSPEAKEKLMQLYDHKESSLEFPIQRHDVSTSYGVTRVLSTGPENGRKLVVFHGIHAGAPLTLESVQYLQTSYRIYAIDTVGQATKSAETTIDLKNDSYARWAEEVLSQLSIAKADFIGISYGAFILQKLITSQSDRVEKCIFIVPSGLANGDFWPSFKKLSIPLIQFLFSKKDKHLRKFIGNFIPEDDEYMFEFQKALLLGVHMDYRRPGILRREDVTHFTHPVYILTADDDVFFPHDKVSQQARKIFKNLKEIHLLKDCKHMPAPTHLAEIEGKLSEWLSQ